MRLGDRLAGRVHARGLATAHPDQPAVADEDDRVRGHAADQAPGEVEVELLRGRSGRDGSRRSRRSGRRRLTSGVVTRTAPPAVRIEPVGSGGLAGASSSASASSRSDAQVRLGREDLEGVGVEGGRDDDLEEDRDEALRGRAVDRPGQRDDPTEGADRVGLERGVPGVGERRALRRAARVRVLDDDDARAAQGTTERRRGGRIEDVVVGQGLALERAARRRRTGRPRGSRRVAGSGRPAGAGSRRSAASRPSRDRWSATPGTGRRARRAGPAVDHPAGQLRGDPGVVGGGVRERLERERAAVAARRARRRCRARRGPRRSAPATSRPRRWRGSWRRPGPSTARRCRSPR